MVVVSAQHKQVGIFAIKTTMRIRKRQPPTAPPLAEVRCLDKLFGCRDAIRECEMVDNLSM